MYNAFILCRALEVLASRATGKVRPSTHMDGYGVNQDLSGIQDYDGTKRTSCLLRSHWTVGRLMARCCLNRESHSEAKVSSSLVTEGRKYREETTLLSSSWSCRISLSKPKC
jgi:hypothetical protein